MLLKKTWQDLAPIALPHGPPVVATSDYFRSRMEDGQVRVYPNPDIARPTPQVLAEQARRELEDAQERLEKKRKEYASYRVEMDEKWGELREKELQLRQSFINFNKFIRENKAKRERADRKMFEDLETLDKKRTEVDAMKGRIVELKHILGLMEHQVQQYSIYEDYLLSVVVAYPDFKNPMDVVNRFEALDAAKCELARRQEEDLETLENARNEMIRLAEEKKLLIMGLNNTLATLRWRYGKARNKVMKWELALNRLKDTAAQKYIELAQVRSAVWVLYLKICKQKGIAVEAEQTDFEAQLVVVMRALIELKKILKIAKQRSAHKRINEEINL